MLAAVEGDEVMEVEKVMGSQAEHEVEEDSVPKYCSTGVQAKPSYFSVNVQATKKMSSKGIKYWEIFLWPIFTFFCCYNNR